ncbi:MAG: hypothetical protein JXR90_10130 [Spirochaetes bacterium]|nr:hypothetical protein [Spirochaetota bacterium]
MNKKFYGKTLLMAKEDMSGLEIVNNGWYKLVEVSEEGEINAFLFNGEDKARISRHPFAEEKFSKRLVLPEMEVERIFNSLRYKYLNALLLSGFKNPQKYISADYNKAYQTLAGHTVYQGGTSDRKDNDFFWKNAGFSQAAKDQNWDNERDELQAIIGLLKGLYKNDPEKLYMELIAIKPGLHELLLHPDFFEDIPYSDAPRDIVIRILKNEAEISELSLSKLPNEINKANYFSFASCYATEGPFMFRKNMDVTYLETIRKVRSKMQLSKVYENFHILDYYKADLSSSQKLEEFLQKAEKFKYFIQ